MTSKEVKSGADGARMGRSGIERAHGWWGMADEVRYRYSVDGA